MTHQKTTPRRVPAVRSAALFAALAWPLMGHALAQEAEAGPADEKALAVLQGMSDYLEKETSVSFRARTFFDAVQETGIKVKMAREVEVVMGRPSRLYATTVDDAGIATSIWHDGSKLTVWRRSSNEFMKLDFTGDTDKLLDELIDKYEFQVPLADLLYSNVSKALGENLLSSEYIGIRTVDGVPCHQISFESDGADWQLWIEADSTPVPRRFVIDFTSEESQPQFMAQLDAWSLGGELEEFRFEAAMPEGVKELEFGKATADGQTQQ